MIPKVEILMDSVREEELLNFSSDDSSLLRQLLMCQYNGPIKDYHKFQVTSLILAPEHVKWLKEELDDWVVVEHRPQDGFVYWFASEQDAIYFQLAFG